MERFGLGPEERELKLGASFTNPKATAFHTLRYDFKPASVDTNKMATIDVGPNSQITVTVPPNLTFKGSAKAYQKQGIAILNTLTGEVTLEKLSSNIIVKQIRSENQKMSAQKMSMIDQFIAGQKPKRPGSSKPSKSHVSNSNNSNSNNNSTSISNSNSNSISNTNMNTNSNIKNNNKSNTFKEKKKRKVDFPLSGSNINSNMNNLLPSHANPIRNSPNSIRSSPNPIRSSPNSQGRFMTNMSPLNASPPKAPVEDKSSLDDWFGSRDSGKSNSMKQNSKKVTMKEELKPSTRLNDEVEELSDSSSSCGSSSSGDSSDSSSDSEEQPKKEVDSEDLLKNNLLKEDLQLSESGSDSD